MWPFKSRHQREKERLEKEANLERAYDLGRKTAQTVIPILDEFFEQRALPVAGKLASMYREAMQEAHKQTEADAIQQRQWFEDAIRDYEARMRTEAGDALGEWKYTLIETGLRDEFDRYITVKLENITTALRETSNDELLYALLRIRGEITDEEHRMSPEEFRAHREQKAKSGQT